VYEYGHFLVAVGITAAAVGLQTTILTEPDEFLALSPRLALAGGLAAFLLGATVGHWVMPHSLDRVVRWARLLVVALCLLLIPVGSSLAPPTFTWFFAILFAALFALEI
jgi:low temperature requirement protein LtrA